MSLAHRSASLFFRVKLFFYTPYRLALVSAIVPTRFLAALVVLLPLPSNALSSTRSNGLNCYDRADVLYDSKLFSSINLFEHQSTATDHT